MLATSDPLTTAAVRGPGHDIRHGAAVIPWGALCRPRGAIEPIPAGWVLPGGRRTLDRAEAVGFANLIDALTEAHRIDAALRTALRQPVAVSIAS